jgi:hypothetical protein
MREIPAPGVKFTHRPQLNTNSEIEKMSGARPFSLPLVIHRFSFQIGNRKSTIVN